MELDYKEIPGGKEILLREECYKYAILGFHTAFNQFLEPIDEPELSNPKTESIRKVKPNNPIGLTAYRISPEEKLISFMLGEEAYIFQANVETSISGDLTSYKMIVKAFRAGEESRAEKWGCTNKSIYLCDGGASDFNNQKRMIELVKFYVTRTSENPDSLPFKWV